MLLDVRLELWVKHCVGLHAIDPGDLRFGVARQLVASARAKFEDDTAGGANEGGGGCFFLVLKEELV